MRTRLPRKIKKKWKKHGGILWQIELSGKPKPIGNVGFKLSDFEDMAQQMVRNRDINFHEQRSLL